LTRTAEGFYEPGETLTPVPKVRIAVGFGPGQVLAFTAVVDTGSDVCIFPAEPFRGIPLGEPAALLQVSPFGGDSFGAPARLPSISMGDLRETEGLDLARAHLARRGLRLRCTPRDRGRRGVRQGARREAARRLTEEAGEVDRPGTA